ncbi:pilus assembly protein FimV [Pseudoxanthomonas wuyuanensis]|uniref:Pilus assembly protein FimV n=1 Tax=Pseudoxanthomonas wuyuanensis TaxID=1073196 RepID=A0A286D987_9GAMM|nr:pilus assembly protein FimV [Pseudoxanthomonas wuyuanensis]
MTLTARQRWQGLAGLLLTLVSSAAFALGLGEIRVKSQPGQPLLAEIPIISNEPGELEQLNARLASPVTFERVGLPRPQGLVNDLNFAVALDDSGRPVIRVTSNAPVDVPALNFLIEVDWGQGRLVREYSALVSAPGAVAAAVQPIIDAPVAAPTDIIVRAPETPAVASELPAEPPAQPAEAAPATPAAPAAPAAAVAAQPAPRPVPSGEPAPVRRGQTLSQIARDLRPPGYSLDQTMIALLRANPEAFINGNINLLKQGAVLRMPQSEELAQLGAAEASALVRTQIAEWRQARRPIPQPAAIADMPASAGAAAQPAVADARLEISPPAAGAATQAGTQSGNSAGGEGDMLANASLQQTQEDLAARESEVQELRAQVAELEKLQQQQQKLIAMKDSDLAAAQQRLAETQGGAGTPLWLWAGFALLLLGALAWGLAQRRQRLAPSTAPRRPVFDSAALAAAVPATAAAGKASETAAPAAEPEAPAAQPPQAALFGAGPAAPAPAPAVAKPTWHSGDGAAHVAPLNPAPAGRERLELAVAYLDLGDVVTARDLLNEVVAGGDAGARDEALQLLREIG